MYRCSQFYVGVHIFCFLILALYNCSNRERSTIITSSAGAELLILVPIAVIKVRSDVQIIKLTTALGAAGSPVIIKRIS